MQTNLSAQEFAGKLLGIYTGGVLTKLIDIGCQTGLFEASVEGAATSDELAARRGSMSAMSANGWARWRQAASSFTTQRAGAIGCRKSMRYR
jgi:hypothetical protein